MKRHILTIILLVLTTWPVFAQAPGLPKADAKPAASVALPDPLTQEAVRNLLSELDDKQVRTLLLKRLNEDIAKRTEALAKRNNVDPLTLTQTYARKLGIFFLDVGAKVPAIPSSIAGAVTDFQAQRGPVPLSNLLWSLAACLALGAGGAFLATRLARPLTGRIGELAPSTLGTKIRWLSLRFAVQAIGVLVFAILAASLNKWLNAGVPADGDTVARIISAIAWTWFAVVVARFLLSPTAPHLRLARTDDATAAFLTWRVFWIAALYNFGFGLVWWMVRFGMQLGDSWIGVWVNLAFHILIGVTIWQARYGITAMLKPSEDADDAPAKLFAVWWPTICIAMLVLNWLTAEIIVATSSIMPGLLRAMATTLVLITGLPILEQATRAIVLSVFPIDTAKDPALQAADRQTQLGIVRIARVALAIACAALLIRLWHVDVMRMADEGLGSHFASSLIDVSLIIVVAYGLWELLSIVVNRQIAIERVALGIDPDGPSANEGEAGGAGARLGTLLPLVKVAAQITIVVLASLAVLGEMGVNVLPLLAGAGIVGIAIGFGAQTLVKDVISGVFFLIDDAFRMGEFIEIGDVKGTVEKISIRSMQLRHQNGPLNTVPFGDIRHVTNFSRDWVIMKLPLRLTYDTDAEKVRKMIKKLGEELLEDPAIGQQFLQPLKSQGVIQMEDSAMIMRVKFMTRPGDQWLIRRIVLAKIRDLFEEKGIRFASREVTVRISREGAGDITPEEESQAVAASAARLIQDKEGTTSR